MTDKLHRILPTVQKPARYIGGEYRQVIKEKKDVNIRVAFCFPDTYEIGMSNLGLRILYGVLNRIPDVWCERVFMPWGDMADAMQENDIPLYALESKDPVKDFDLVSFSIGYEMSYLNILNMMLLSGIAPLAKDRGGLDEIVFAGGVCAYNPEPLADFFDFFVLGEGEDVIIELMDIYRTAKQEQWQKDRFLKEVSKIEGVYVPSFYEHIYGEDGALCEIRALCGAPKTVKKRIVQSFDDSFFPVDGIVPSTEIVHDRANLEVFRGCIRGCRFCQAGYCYRPVRPRNADTLLRQAQQVLADSGNQEITLASLSTSDYKQLEQLALPLIDFCEPRMVNVSLPSLRADNFSRELMMKVQKVRKSGLTFAPEAGTQRLRDAINKNVTEAEILETCATAFSGGWNNVKLYFMLGLPTETDEDVLGIAELTYKIIQVWKDNATNKKRGLTINLATAFFVPKPFTPFQWEAQITPEEYTRRVRLLKEQLHSRCVDYRYHGAELSFLEAVLARGDRRLAPVLLEAVKNGARLDSWNEYFRPEIWQKAFETCGVDPAWYAQRAYGKDEVLPWDTLSIGVNKAFFWRERERAYRGETTPSCREQCSGCGADKLLEGGVCDA
ncbi:MAG: TIGR03960 family B12-binding radical SAM protein [Oscillospiraceae bacterium]|nr:TIGR03960 family B12-binding radical SAM protein [Oscillospiraceae bacterium]